MIELAAAVAPQTTYSAANFTENVGRLYERVQWQSPFYKAINHGLYVAFDDECYDEHDELTKKGMEFLQKKKIRALIVHPRRWKLESNSALAIYVRPMKNLQKWLREDLKIAAQSHASIGILIDVADAQSLVILSMLHTYMKSTTIISSLKTVCEVIGGGGLISDCQAPDLLEEFLDSQEDLIDAPPLSATAETLEWFRQQEELHDFAEYDIIIE